MFNLIICIIAIALVVMLAGTSLHFMGGAFDEASKRARGLDFLSTVTTIAHATVNFRNEYQEFPSKEDLIAKSYVHNRDLFEHNGYQWVFDDFSEVPHIVLPNADIDSSGISSDMCMSINEKFRGAVKCTVNEEHLQSSIDFGPTDIQSLESAEEYVVLIKRSDY